MKYLIIATVLIASSLAQAMSLTDLSVEYKHAIDTNRHWTIPKDEPKKGEVNLHMRHDNEYVFSKVSIYTMFTNHQFRYGALEGELGFKINEHEVFIHHKSEHKLDGRYGKWYPNQNAIGVRIKLN